MARPAEKQLRYYPAQSMYQRPGHAIFNGSFINARPRPFDQGRDNGLPDLQISRPPDFSNKLQFRYYPAQSTYQRKSRPNGQAEATGWPDLQILGTNCNFAVIPHNQFISGRAKLFSSKSRPNGRFIRSNGRFINARPNGRFIKAEATGRPGLQISATTCNFAIIPHNQFISGRAELFSSKGRPMAVLSTPGPMAVLTTGKLFSAKACPMAVLSTRAPMAVLSTPGPMAVLSRQRQRMARPPDFNNKLQFRYYPAQSMYQRPG